MNLINEIKKRVPLNGSVITFSKSGGYVGGVKRVVSFTQEQIVLECASGMVVICGLGLELIKLAQGDAGFKGKIFGVQMQ